MIGCNHGLWVHRTEPRPQFTAKGRLLNPILWTCTVPDCTCQGIIKPDDKKKEESD